MTTDALRSLRGWALVLGASSGFGEATSLALARAGLDVFGVHLDRRATLPNVERIVAEIRALGREAHFFNVNAADEEKRAEVADRDGARAARARRAGAAARDAALPGLRHPQALRRRSR